MKLKTDIAYISRYPWKFMKFHENRQISFNFLNLIRFEFFVAAEIKRQMWQSDDQKRINLNYEVGILNSRWHFGIFSL